MHLRRGIALLAVLAAAACAHAPPDVAPILDLADRSCVPEPALAAALATAATVDGDREKPAVATIDAQTPCLAGPAGKSLYVLFALPGGGPYTISLSSVPLGRSLFAPRASVLDGDGKLLRDLPIDGFLFRGTNLTTLYRSHPGERYLLVASDPPSVGRLISRVNETVQQTYASTGYATFVIYTGSDIATDTTWAHNGEVTLSVVADKPAPKK
ncbi:MAG TPA: hypothetical protein VNU97_01850 [Rhizomicrobium sp.]|nr:hypothetical protein [Rhizomicrobium sp.]